MRKKITLFLLLSIISIFIGIREEAKTRAYLYTFINSEIKESNQKKDKHILSNASNENKKLIVQINRDRKNKNDDNITTYLINSSFSPIYSFNLSNYKICNFYSFQKIENGILNRYEKRVLQI
ncbi:MULTISPECIES: hypothetical protein [Cetobacterium]|jgi:hypothetical protein|uniref:Fam-c protein n=1 Tax=Candidatus Cetobacterium colombiensis TaxID=3073100 RepID=A0ABU4WCS4_9FUSO|nr:hypothetical protein [Candidatus Cetobacterium colombiensis]MDX8336504.1 hypothetical protein [Candidatus Cetobacterium colombiensis]